MQSENNNENLTLKELLEKKERLLKEKEQIIKERNEIIREQQMPLRDVGTTEKNEPSVKPKATSEQSSFPGIFGSASSSSSQKPESDGRRNFLRNLSLGITLTISSIGVVLLLSAPSIERAAYFQLCILFEQGSIFFTNKIRKEIESADWVSIVQQTEPQGELDAKMLEPLLFWTNGNAGDPDLAFVTGLQEATTSYRAAADRLRAAAQAGDATTARTAWADARAAINRFARLVNTRTPPELVPLSEI